MACSAATIDFGGWTTAEKQALFDAIKAEVLRRITGSVQSGSSSAQSFSVMKMSDDALARLNNALIAELGYEQPVNQVAPNFAGTAWEWPNNYNR